MQAAFLILAGQALKAGVEKTKAEWASNLRSLEEELFPGDDVAFYGDYSLLATDQGVRGFLHITNDLCYLGRDKLGLDEWRWEYRQPKKGARDSATDEELVASALASLRKTKVASFLVELGREVAKFDWRTSSTPGLSARHQATQAVYRGSGGYKALRYQLALHLSKSSGAVGSYANALLPILSD